MDDPQKQLHEMMRSLERHERELARLDALRADELDRIEAWFADASSGEQRRITELREQIAQWAKTNRDDETMSWKTPWGTVSTNLNSVGQTKIDDDAAARAWALRNGFLAEQKPAPERAVDVKKLRAATKVVDGRLVTGDGEIVPGVHVEGAGEIGVAVKVDHR